MDANQLMFWLRGVFEFKDSFNPEQIGVLRDEILRSTPVEHKIIPITMSNPIDLEENTNVAKRFEPCPDKRRALEKLVKNS